MKNKIAITAIITAGIVALVIHFTPRPQPKAAAGPTAHGMSQAELFNMNGKCAQLAEKLSETSGVHGDALSGDYKSHYNPRTNRCYVRSRWPHVCGHGHRGDSLQLIMVG